MRLLLAIILACGFGFVAIFRAEAQVDRSSHREVEGHVFDIVRRGANFYVVMIDGFEVLDTLNIGGQFSLKGVFESNDKSFIVVARTTQNCPSRLIAFDVSDATVMHSELLGSCSNSTKIAAQSGKLVVTSPAGPDRQTSDVFTDGRTYFGLTPGTLVSISPRPDPSYSDVVPSMLLSARFFVNSSLADAGYITVFGQRGIARLSQSGDIELSVLQRSQDGMRLEARFVPASPQGAMTWIGRVAQDGIKGTVERTGAPLTDITWQGTPVAMNADRAWTRRLQAMRAGAADGLPAYDELVLALFAGVMAEDPRAFAALGAAYYVGLSVPKSQQIATRLWQRGWDVGCRDCANFLGASFEAGTGVPKNEGTAHDWYDKAGTTGFAPVVYEQTSDVPSAVGWIFSAVNTEDYRCSRSAECVARRLDQLQREREAANASAQAGEAQRRSDAAGIPRGSGLLPW